MTKRKKLIIILSSILSVLIVSASFLVAFLVDKSKNKNYNNDLFVEGTVLPDDVTLEQMGGSIYVENGSTYTMRGGEIIGAETDYGGAVFVSANSTFIMESGTIKGCSAIYGGAIFVESGGTCIINGGNITDCEASVSGGAIFVEDGGKLQISNAGFNSNKAVQKGGAIRIATTSYVDGSSSVKISNSSFTNNEATSKSSTTSPTDERSYGGAICITKGTLTVNNCDFSGNSTFFRGGAIYSQAAIIVSGESDFSENQATGSSGEGGAICCGSGSLTLGSSSIDFGGSFTKNHGNGGGGAIFISGGSKVYQYGGTIGSEVEGEGNTGGNGGGVYLYSNAKYYIYENTKIIGNTARSKGGGIFVGYTPTKPENVILSINDTNFELKNNKAANGGGLYLNKGLFFTLKGKFLNNQATTGSGGGMYIEANGQTTLNNCVISGNTAAKNGAGIYSQGPLTTSSGVEVKENIAGSHGGGLFMSSTSSLTLNNSTPVTENTATSYGGGIYLAGTLNVSGNATINKNTASTGGGLYVDTTGVLTINSCTINENTAKSAGGGIYTTTSSTFTMNNGAQINSNLAKNNNGSIGGGAYFGGTALINGGEISNNYADFRGGGVYAAKTLVLTGSASINKNQSREDGGGIYVFGATAYIGTNGSNYEGTKTAFTGTISENISSGLGGGLSVYGSTAQVYHHSGCIEKNKGNSASGVGLFSSATYTLDGGVVQENIANAVGGSTITSSSNCTLNILNGLIDSNIANGFAVDGLAIRAGGTTNISGGTISNHTTTGFGTINISGTLNLSGGTISDNIAKHGGAIYVSKILNMTGGTISKNKATTSGGGIYGTTAQITITNGELTDNESVNGGAICTSNTQLTISSIDSEKFANIHNNRATKSAGAIYAGSSTTTISGLTKVTNNSIIASAETTYYGGAVTISAGKLIMTGGEISGTTLNVALAPGAKLDGAGISSGSGAWIEISGGKITNNKGPHGFGGGIKATYGTYEKDGVTYYSKLIITGGEISNNEAMMGAGIYGGGSKKMLLEISGGSISNNTATQTGGGLEVSSITVDLSGNFKISGNKIITGADDQEKSSGRGAGFAINNADVRMSGGEISNNKVYWSEYVDSAWGGGIYLTGTSKLAITGGKVSNNIVSSTKEDGSEYLKSSGANIYINRNSLVVMAGGEISGDGETLQARLGGGITNVGQLYISGGTIKNCKATNGGGIVSYGGFNIKEQSGEKISDGYNLLKNKLVVTGDASIIDCEANYGSSIAVSHAFDLSGNVNINGKIALMETKIIDGTLSTGEVYWAVWGTEADKLERKDNIFPKISVSDQTLIPEDLTNFTVFNQDTDTKLNFVMSNGINPESQLPITIEFVEGYLDYEVVAYNITGDSLTLDGVYINELNGETPAVQFLKGTEDLLLPDYFELEVGYGFIAFPDDVNLTGYELAKVGSVTINVVLRNEDGQTIDVLDENANNINRAYAVSVGTRIQAVDNNIYFGRRLIVPSSMDGYQVLSYNINQEGASIDGDGYVISASVTLEIVLEVQDLSVTITWQNPETLETENQTILQYTNDNNIKYDNQLFRNGVDLYLHIENTDYLLFTTPSYNHNDVKNFILTFGKVSLSGNIVEVDSNGDIWLDENKIKVLENGNLMFNDKEVVVTVTKTLYSNGVKVDPDENGLLKVGDFVVDILDNGNISVDGSLVELSDGKYTLSTGEEIYAVISKKATLDGENLVVSDAGTITIDGYTMSLPNNGVVTLPGNSLTITKDGAIISAGDKFKIKSNLSISLIYKLSSYNTTVKFIDEDYNILQPSDIYTDIDAKTVISASENILQIGGNVAAFNSSEAQSIIIEAGEREGYTFVNWCREDGTTISPFELVKNEIVYAMYKANTYTLSVVYEASERVYHSYEIKYNNQIKVSVDAITTSGEIEDRVTDRVTIYSKNNDIYSYCDYLRNESDVFVGYNIAAQDTNGNSIPAEFNIKLSVEGDITVTVLYDHWFTFDCVDNSYYEVSQGNLSYQTGEKLSDIQTLKSVSSMQAATPVVDQPGTVAIPRMFKNLPVTAIKENGFKNRTDITFLKLSTRITKIGESAFEGCSELVEVNSFVNISDLGDKAFKNCSNLVGYYEFPALRHWYSSYFEGSSIEGINLYESEISGFWGDDYNVIYNLKSLKHLVLPRVEVLGQKTIVDCNSLQTVFIPSSVKTIAELDYSSYIDGGIYNYYTLRSNSFIVSTKKDGSYQPPTIYLETGFDDSHISDTIKVGATAYVGETDFGGTQDYIMVEQSQTAWVSGTKLSLTEYLESDAVLNQALCHWHDGEFTYYGFLRADGLTYNYLIGEGVIEKTEFAFPGKLFDDSIDFGYISGLVDYGFKNCDYLTSVTDARTYTGDLSQYHSIGAFMNCVNLKTVSLHWAEITIADYMFYNCVNLETCNIPPNGKIGDFAFYNCVKYKSTSDDLTFNECTIGVSAFEGCDAIESVNFADHSTSANTHSYIGDRAFYNCKNLVSVDSYDVAAIGSEAFGLCTKLASVSIEGTVQELGDKVFNECSSLLQINIEMMEFDINNSDYKWSEIWLDGCDALVVWAGKNVEKEGIIYQVYSSSQTARVVGYNLEAIPVSAEIKASITDEGVVYNVQEIAGYAFNNCGKLTSIVIPASIVRIGGHAFKGSGLTGITIPNSVKVIDSSAFANCLSLTDVTLPNSLTRIQDNLFDGCENLTQITIPANITYLGKRAFAGTNLTYDITSGLTIPSTVTHIGSNVFNGCENLKLVNYYGLQTATYISSEWIDGCSASVFWGESDIRVQNGVKYQIVGNNAFKVVGVEGGVSGNITIAALVIGLNVRFIQDRAFENNTAITKVEIVNGLNSYIGEYAFKGCSNLKELKIGEGITEIKKSAFFGCSALENVVIPESVTAIGLFAFEECEGLRTVNIMADIETIAAATFRRCFALEYIDLPQNLKTIDDYAFNWCENLKEINIPEGVTTIGIRAFNYCKGLKQVVVPNSVTSIGESAFASCYGLASVKLPENSAYDTVSAGLFFDCVGLEAIVFPENVKYINAGALRFCRNLTSVRIPENVLTLGAFAFAGCWKLKIVDILSMQIQVLENVFSESPIEILRIAVSYDWAKAKWILNGIVNFIENIYWAFNNF